MKYADFYISAKEKLVNSLVSLWFRGKPQEQEYVRRILTEDEPLLSEPVFQSRFPWEESDITFAEHSSKLHLLQQSFVDALSSDNIDEELRFPKDRHPYKHQTESWKTMLSDQGKSIVVTSGTGSGKTECFMIPVLHDIAQRGERDCVQAIFLYPLNALMKSQQKRIHAWCDAIPGKVTYAIYNGDTEKNRKPERVTAPFYPQLITRPQIRQTPPQILFTNPTMLNYMLVRAEDREILEKSKGKLKWILLDEAHTYTGSSASELSLQLRRVLDAFGVTVDQVNFAVTSATIGDGTDPDAELKLKMFVAQLTGKPKDDITVIGGKRIVPEINQDKARESIDLINSRFNSSISLAGINKLRNELNNNPVLSATELVKIIEKKGRRDITEILQIIDALGEKVQSLNSDGRDSALLPSRGHFFIRSINGIYICVNPECSRHKGYRLDIGNLTTYQNTICPECKSKMLELATCSSCGGTLVVGENSTSKGFQMHTNVIDLDKSLFYETQNDDLLEYEDGLNELTKEEEADGFTAFYFSKPKSKCLRHHTTECRHVFNHGRGKIEIAEENTNSAQVYTSLRHSDKNNLLCPHCGNATGYGKVNYLRASATQMGRILSTLLLDQAESLSKPDAEILYEGKKYITFTDNRQGSARSAMGINQDVERAWIRSSIFHRLADLRLEKIETHSLSNEEEQTYQYLAQIRSTLPPMLIEQLKSLEARRNGKGIIPKPSEVEWQDIVRNLENNSDFKKLFKHLKETRGNSKYIDASTYLKALLVDQFGWIPKHSNSLENMGFVRLVYPNLTKAKCPQLLLSKGATDDDWRAFLKICLDYTIRGGRHYMLAEELKDYLTQTKYNSAIYPANSELKKNGYAVSKWPKFQIGNSGIADKQSRLVLLLCAALEYDNIDTITPEKLADVNGLLETAWQFLTTNILDVVDVENQGYMLDLMGDKVKLQLLEKGYLCPVDNVIVDTAFMGFSPRINGYIGSSNFERFKIEQEILYPYFPFSSTNVDASEIRKWIEDNMGQLFNTGLYSDIYERVYIKKPIYLAAEHSAQQSSEDLDRYEKEFNLGQLNILSCSTTMEMGVDIGGISEVVMNNVPPKSANYLQRAGRAGRRNETRAMALTFCAPNPIGVHTWNNPEYPITHVTEMPSLKLESRQLIQRHINALIFADFVKEQGGFKVTSKLYDFFKSDNGMTLFDFFLVYLDRLIGGINHNIDSSFSNLVRGTCLCKLSIQDAAVSTKRDINYVRSLYEAHIDSLNKSIKTLEDEGGNTKAIRALEKQKTNFLETALLSYLAENSFLPSAGIPTGLVQCILGSNVSVEFPTMHLSQAISAYAPGNKVIKNEWVYEPEGIQLKSKYENNSARYILQNCSQCGYTTINYGNAISNCPKCGKAGSMHGIRDISVSTEQQRFTEVVEPAAFSVSFGAKPVRKMDSNPSNFIQPVLLEMDPWGEKSTIAKMVLRSSTPKSEILFYNRGRNNVGYAFCPYCGRMKSEGDISTTNVLLANHHHLITGTRCPGGESNGGLIRRHVLLVGRYQTDFVEIKFFDENNVLIEDTDTLYSLGVILSRKLAEILGVNDGEIDFGYDGNNHSIFIYDTALGGSGYSILFKEYRDLVLQKAYDTLASCKCDKACTSCLIDRRSQWYLNYLNRHKAMQWLEMELKSRIAPDSIKNIVRDAVAVTTDIHTEIFQLLNNPNIKAINVFINDDYEDWQLNEFPLIRIIEELSSKGADVSFVVPNKIEINKLSSNDRTILLSLLVKYPIVVSDNSQYGNLKSLLSVQFNDEQVRTYFGNNVNLSLSRLWGMGDIYHSSSISSQMGQRINIAEILSDLVQTNDSLMFDTRVVEDCNTDNLYTLLINAQPAIWDRIKTFMDGGEVDIEYSDRYLHSPLGCILLAHMINNIQSNLCLNIRRIKIYVTKISGNSNDDSEIFLYNNYNDNQKRNIFLKQAITEIAGFVPEIVDAGYIRHERCLSIMSEKGDLCIRPDAGIAYGWRPFGPENALCKDSDFQYNWELNLKLYNQRKNNGGILYTISYSKHN